MKLARLAALALLAAALCLPLASPADSIDQLARARALLAEASAALRAARGDDTRLADIAPTLLALMGLAEPPEMTGVSLLTGPGA